MSALSPDTRHSMALSANYGTCPASTGRLSAAQIDMMRRVADNDATRVPYRFRASVIFVTIEQDAALRSHRHWNCQERI